MKYLCLTSAAVLVAVLANAAVADDDKSGPPEKPAVDTLIRAELEAVPNTDVILSHVSLPPGAGLASHWHPGEEFAYILDGSLMVKLADDPELEMKAGDYGKVPYKQVHSVKAGDDGVRLIVFRVHEKGAPERVMVE